MLITNFQDQFIGNFIFFKDKTFTRADYFLSEHIVKLELCSIFKKKLNFNGEEKSGGEIEKYSRHCMEHKDDE